VTTGFTKNFVVKNGLTTGNIILDASSSNITANYVVANLSVPASANLGAVGNVHISGGSSGYVLSTDGSGSLSWVAQSGSGGGSVTPSQYITKYDLGTNQSLTNNTDNTVHFDTSVYDPQSWFNTGTYQFKPTIAGYYKITFGAWFTTGSNGTGQQFNVQIRKNGSGLTIVQQPELGNVGQGLIATDTIYLNGGSDYLTFTAYASTGTISLTSGNGTYFEAFLIGSASATSNIGNANSNVNVASANANVTISVNNTSNIAVFANTGVTINGNITTSANSNINVGGELVVNNYNQHGGAGYAGIITMTNSGGGSNPNKFVRLNSTGSIEIINSGYSTTIFTLTDSGNLTVPGNVSASNYIGNGSALSSLTGANVTGQVSNSLVAGTVYTNAQPNITSVGTLTSLTVTGNISSGNANLGNLVTSNYFTGNGSLLTSLTGANVTGTVANATYAASAGSATTSGTVTTNAQPNITSVGTLTSLTVTANITSGNANLGNLVTANYFSGNGSLLTGISGANITGTAANANYAAYAGNVVNASQSNITSLGTLSSLSVTGTLAAGDTTITGNLTITGNHEYVNSTSVNITDPVIQQGGNANGAALASNAGVDLGEILHYYTTAPVDAFMGWKLSAGEFVFASNANLQSNNVVTINTYGNIHAGNANLGNLATASYFSGAGNLLSNIQAANITGTVANANYSLYAGTVLTNAQPNITSIGTLTNLTVTNYVKVPNIQDSTGTNAISTYYGSKAGDVGITGNLSVGTGGSGNVTATYFIGNGSSLTGLNGSNVTGQVSNALIAGTVYTNAQPNITSVGTLANLSVTGNITSGANITATNASLGNLVTSNYFSGNGSLLTSITGGNVTGQVGNSLIAGTVYSNAQPNITSVGTLVSLNVTGNITSGNESTGTLTASGNVTASYIIANGSSLTGTIANANYSLYAGTVLTNAQPNITSVGTLSSVTVTANVAAGNVLTNNLLYANGVAWSFGSGTPGGSNTYVQYNNAGSFGASANFFFNNTSNTLTVDKIAATLTTQSQPNITSVGTLVSLNVTGAVKTPNIQDSSGTNAISTYYGSKAGDIGITGNLTVGTGGTGNISTTGITATGNVTFTSSPNVSLGAVGNVKITGGTTGQYLKTDGTGNLSWATVSGGSGSGITYTANVTPPGTANVADQWFNTSTNTLYEYINDGVANYWVDIQTPTVSSSSTNVTIAGFVSRTYTGDGSTVNFTISSNLSAASVIVTENGVVQVPTTDYTVSGTTLTFISAPLTGVVIQIRELAYATPQVNNLTATGNVAVSNLTISGTANLGPIGNVKITGGTSGQLISTDGTGNLSFITPVSSNARIVGYNLVFGM